MNFFEIHKYPSRKNFPVYGNINRLYIDLESNKFYYWEDGKYFKISTVELDQATYDDIDRKLSGTYETIVNSDNKLALKADKTYVDDIVDSLDVIAANTLVEVTWQELKDKRDLGLLTPGAQYRITDYVTTTTQANTQSAGHQFDIIVVADDVNKLNENTRACLHEGDTYFANSNLSAWQLKYCLDNDTSRFAWAQKEYLKAYGDTYVYVDKRTVALTHTGDTEVYFWVHSDSPHMAVGTLTKPIEVGVTEIHSLYSDDEGVTWYEDDAIEIADFYQAGGKGVIYRMIDEFNNDVPYDFKNILFVKNGIEAFTFGTVPGINYNQWGSNYAVTRNEALDVVVSEVQYYGYTCSDTPSAWSTPNFWITDDLILATSTLYAISGETVTEISYGGTLSVLELSDGSLTNNTRNNVMQSVFSQGPDFYTLNFNTFGVNCYDNTFGNGCSNNTFGDGCSSNTFGDNCSANTLGNYCVCNTFGNSCYSNTFGNGCNNNTFGNDCRSNTFGNSCYSNTFGDNCYDSTFGDRYYGNTFSGGCHNNAFGTFCIYNTFGTNCYGNTFGNSCASNTFGKSCNHNTFGENCSLNTFGNYCSYLQITDASTTAKKYISVDSGVQGASSANKFDLYDPAILNKDYQVTFKKDADGRYVMTWLDDYEKLEGKYKDNNLDTVWKDLPHTAEAIIEELLTATEDTGWQPLEITNASVNMSTTKMFIRKMGNVVALTGTIRFSSAYSPYGAPGSWLAQLPLEYRPTNETEGFCIKYAAGVRSETAFKIRVDGHLELITAQASGDRVDISGFTYFAR